MKCKSTSKHLYLKTMMAYGNPHCLELIEKYEDIATRYNPNCLDKSGIKNEGHKKSKDSLLQKPFQIAHS